MSSIKPDLDSPSYSVLRMPYLLLPPGTMLKARGARVSCLVNGNTHFDVGDQHFQGEIR